MERHSSYLSGWQKRLRAVNGTALGLILIGRLFFREGRSVLGKQRILATGAGAKSGHLDDQSACTQLVRIMLDRPNILSTAGAVPNPRAAEFTIVINWLMICTAAVVEKFAATSDDVVRC